MIRRIPCRGTALTVITLVTATFAGCGPHQETPPVAAAATDSAVTVTAAQRGQIITAPVEEKSYNPTILTTGTVNFNGDKSTQVISSISGPVSRLAVDVGDSVHAGEILATVASPDFAADIAGFRKSETALKNAQRIETLDEKLFANDALARTDLDQAKADLASAEADREAAVQQLSAIGIDSASIEAIRQGKATAGAEAAIRAPIAGVVVERLITPGQLLQAGATATFTLANLSSVWVIGNVFEGDAASVFKGEPAIVRIEGIADSFPGRIDYVGALVDPDSKAMGVRILVPNAHDRLKQNMLVHVEILGARPRKAIVIPVSAVLRDDDNLPFVYLDAGNNRFNRRRIALSGRTGDVYEVTSGLNVGDSLVTQGALFLQEAANQ
ncbi:MAG TPA: efflux RND transporter periplasmic adaptor subunit [Gemmatimonadales bacterium]|jgi:cobalt-zinc-cadmium efflux system membrane fusion protein